MIIRCSIRLAPNEAISGYFFCPSSHDKLAKSEIISISINLNIVQNNLFIIKGIVSGHYSHISKFIYKCIVWTVLLNEDEEGRYFYRSEIRQVLKIRFSQIASK